MDNKSDYFFEAEQITNYLLSAPLQETEKKRYAEAMHVLNIQLSSYEELLWKSMLRSKWRMAGIDAGLALKEPTNGARRKLFVMLAILEASPNYTCYFLSRSYSFFYLFRLAGVGMRAAWRMMVGIVLIKNIQRKCS